MTRTIWMAALLTLSCAPAQADEQADRMRQALERHGQSLVRVEATTYVEVERLPGLTKGTRRSQHVSAAGLVIDGEGLVVFPAKALDPAGDSFALLGANARADVLGIDVVGRDGRLREALWLGRNAELGLAFARVEQLDGLAPVAWSDAAPKLGDPLLVLSLGPSALGRPGTVEEARVSFVTETLLGVTPRLSHALGGLVVAGDAAVGVLSTPPAEAGARGDLLRPDLLAHARAGYVLPTARLRAAFASPPRETPTGLTTRARPWLGTKHALLTEELAAQYKLDVDTGVLILEVYAGSPAAKAKLQPNDVLLDMDGYPLDLDPGERFSDLVIDYDPGDAVPFKVRRGGKTIEVRVTLEEGPTRPARAPRASVTEVGLLLRALTFYDRKDLGLPADQPGVVVVELASDGAASRAGLRPGDILLSIGAQPVGGLQDARERLGAAGTHEVKLRRRDQELTIKVRR